LRDDLANGHQAVRLRVGKRLEQDAVHQREHRTRAAETQPEYQNSRQGESRLPSQSPHFVPEIAGDTNELHVNSNTLWMGFHMHATFHHGESGFTTSLLRMKHCARPHL